MYDLWTWLFFVTAGIGVWAAYDPVAALEKLVLLVVGLVIVLVMEQSSKADAERTFVIGGIGCAVAAAWLGLLVLMPDYGTFDLHDDMLAAALVILLPLGGGSAYWLWQQRRLLSAGMVSLALIWALAMLILTAERSAWLALALASIVGWVVQQRFVWARRRRNLWLFHLFALGAVAVFALYLLLLFAPGVENLIPLGNSATVIQRLDTWRNGMALIQEYPFTGSGLGATAMIYSTYILVSHVPILFHVHNFFLQIAIEQGLLGLLAFGGMATATLVGLWRSWRPGSPFDDGLRIAALIAMVAMLLHGLIDSELYASWLLPLLFLPFGFCRVAARIDQYVIDDFRFGKGKHTQRSHAIRNSVIALASVVGVAGVIGLASLPTVQAAFHANVGAVAQSKIELSVYSWPQWAVQDEVRRSKTIALDTAIAHYEAALTLDVTNITARSRLGQIALSQGNYQDALHHLEQAHATAPQLSMVRRLLGEAFTVSGDVERGAALWNSIAIDEQWIDQRRWWYTHIGETQQEAWLTDAVAARDPQ